MRSICQIETSFQTFPDLGKDLSHQGITPN